MIRLFKIAVIVSILLMGMSCRGLHLVIISNSSVDASFKRTSRLVDTVSGKEVILVPMVHLGSEKGYARVKQYLDSLKANGFVCFFEGVPFVPYFIDTVTEITAPMLDSMMKRKLSANDSLRLDTLQRKLRKILGVDAGGGYTNPDNHSIPRKYRNGKRVEQTDKNTGIYTDQDIWVDYSLSDMVGICEHKYGEIILTDYDFQTPLDQKYKGKKYHSFILTREARDKRLRRVIKQSPHTKIAVVYGYAHTFKMELYLRYLDGYVLDKKYRVPKR